MHRFRNILAVHDGPSASVALLDRVQWLAGINDARVTLVDVAEARPGELSRAFAEFAGHSAGEVEAQVLAIYGARLEEMARLLRAEGVEVETAVEQGTASVQLVRRVLRGGHDLLVKEAEPGDDRTLLRGLDMQLLRKCPCPVWILNGPGRERTRRVLAAVDTMSEDAAHEALNRTVMELATSLARQDHARLEVVSVWNLPEESTLRHGRLHVPQEQVQRMVDRAESRSRERLDALVRTFAADAERTRVLHLKGRPAPTIVRQVEEGEIDTIVMGTVARTGIAGFLMGNTAETILGRVTCSVLAVKPEGFVSPVTA